MDAVYRHYNKTASSKIRAKKYFYKYADLLRYAETGASVYDVMGVDLKDEEKKMIEEYCSINHLKEEGEFSDEASDEDPVLENITDVIPNNVELKTLKERKKRNNLHYFSVLKYLSDLHVNYVRVENPERIITPRKDILFYIRVYKPFPWSKNIFAAGVKRAKILINCVVAILGSQTLADLRDIIFCSSDLCLSVESSNTPNICSYEMAKDKYKSGFFFIENTFYNDFRDETNIDTSKVIVDWAKSHKLGPFKTSSMENVRIDSLKVRYGFPWVYQHQGNCEHVILFSNARIVNYDDELALSAYPKIVKTRSHMCKYCVMCGLFPISWITTENSRVPHDPCYFCDSCFKSYNYVDGKKIGKFKAYPVKHNSLLAKQAEDYAKEH